MSESVTFSIRIPTDLLERIDESAQRTGETRSTYILSWLPEYHDTDRRHRARNTENGSNTTTHNAR